MSNEHQNQVARVTSATGVGKSVNSSPSHPEESSGSMLKTVHMLLRGRYHWAIILGLIFGVAGCFAAYKYFPLKYESIAQIRIEPTLPKILYELEDANSIPMFDAFVNAQIAQMLSTRVVTMAMDNDEWKKVANRTKIENTEGFREALSIAQPRRSQLIIVNFSHDEKDVAFAGVKAIVDSYMTVYDEKDTLGENKRLSLLRERREALTLEAKSRREEIFELAKLYGSDSLDQIYAKKLENVYYLESELRQAKADYEKVKLYLEKNGQSEATPENGDTQADENITDPQQLPVQELLKYDRQLVEYHQRKEAYQRMLTRMKHLYGANHRSLRLAQADYDAAVKEYDDYVQKIRNGEVVINIQSRISNGSPLSMSQYTQSELQQLKLRYEKLQERYDKDKKDTVELGINNLKIKDMKANLNDIESRLDLTKKRMEAINVESEIGGRISILSHPEYPITPANNKKRVQVTILGAVGGVAMGFGLIMCVGFINPKMRDSVDADDGKLTILGVVPEMSEDNQNPLQNELAASSLHHIRLMLQLKAQRDGSTITVVTGPSAASGKTSMVMALGLSYASTGTRTLLIDADLTGIGLTRRTEAIQRRKLGQVLIRDGVINSDQLNHSLSHADQNSMQLGAALIELNYISEEQLEEALGVQAESNLGLLNAMETDDWRDCVTSIGKSNLFVLPAGSGLPGDAGHISPDKFRIMLSEMKDYYDKILIDTGPIPGALDASIVSALSESVVMVISRGENKSSIKACQNKLTQVGAKLIGMIFNRAEENDVNNYSYSSNSQGGSIRAFRVVPPMGDAEEVDSAKRYGPLADALNLHSRASSSRKRIERAENT